MYLFFKNVFPKLRKWRLNASVKKIYAEVMKGRPDWKAYDLRRGSWVDGSGQPTSAPDGAYAGRQHVSTQTDVYSDGDGAMDEDGSSPLGSGLSTDLHSSDLFSGEFEQGAYGPGEISYLHDTPRSSPDDIVDLADLMSGTQT